MSINNNQSGRYNRENSVDTQASTTGQLPDSIGVLLLGLSYIAVIGIGASLNYPVLELSAVFGAGLLAAVGVRTAASEHPLRVAMGVIILWTSALIFTLTTAALIIGTSNPTDGLIFTLAVASASLLSPFGILSNTLQSFGHGVGRNILNRYLTGCLVLTGVAVLILATSVIFSNEWLTSLGGDAITPYSSVSEIGIYPQAILAVFLYAVFFILGSKVLHQLPLEVLVTANALDRVDAMWDKIDRLTQLGFRATMMFMLLVVGSFILSASSDTESPVTNYLHEFISITTSLPVIVVVTVLIVAMSVLYTATTLSHRATSVNGLDIIETFGPPVVIIGITAIGAITTGDVLGDILTDIAPQIGAEEGEITYQLITGQPSLVLLLVATIALLASALVLSVPSFLARTNPGDVSLTGLTSGVIGVAVLVCILILSQGEFTVILGGVLISAAIWEIGEYSIVANGELQPKNSSSQRHSEVISITGVHIMTTAFVAIVGAAVAMISLMLVSGLQLTTTSASIALVLGTIALITILSVVSG